MTKHYFTSGSLLCAGSFDAVNFLCSSIPIDNVVATENKLNKRKKYEYLVLATEMLLHKSDQEDSSAGGDDDEAFADAPDGNVD